MTFPSLSSTSQHAALSTASADEDFVLIGGAGADHPTVKDADTSADLKQGRWTCVLGRVDRMRWEFKNKAMDATVYLDRLLDMLGDSDLSDENKAAAPYLQALRDLKSSMPRLGLFGAKPWPEAMVATALASTRPAAPRHMRELEDPARATEIRRWNSRVIQFVEHGLIRRDRRDGLLMDTTARAASSPTPSAPCLSVPTTRPCAPSLLSEYVVLDMEGGVEHEPRHRLGDRLQEAVADGDVDTTRSLLERIHLRSGWAGEIDASTHFGILKDAFEAGVHAGHEETSTACLRAMAQDAELKAVAQGRLPEVLSIGGTTAEPSVVSIPPERLGRKIRHIAQAALAGLVRPDGTTRLLRGDGSRPLLRDVLVAPDRFHAVVQAYARAGRDKVIRGESLKALMQARNDGGTVLLAAARQNVGEAVLTFMDAAHAMRRGNVLSDKAYLQLITEGSGDTTVMAALCAPPSLLHLDRPTNALKAYLDGLLMTRLSGAKSLGDQAFEQVLLAPGSDGKPAIGQCAPDQAAMIRSKLQDALDVALLDATTVQNILRHLPASGQETDVPAPVSDEVDQLSGDDAALAWELVRSPSGFEPAHPRRASRPRGRTDDFATPQRFSKA